MILSSRQQPYDPVRGAEVQADDFIDKPFDTQQMRDKVKKLVAQNGSVRAPAPAKSAQAATAAPARPAPIPRTPPPAMPPPPVGRAQAPVTAAPAARSAGPAHAPAPSIAAQAISQNGAVLRQRLESLDLTPEQTQAILTLSREVIEKVVWEVVPVLAETLIKEEIARLTRE
jgi:DNA-binding response OmpR family regulator